MIDNFFTRLSNGSIQCSICPNNCELKEGQRGRCFARQNIRGNLELTISNKASSIAVDPIEKKPLYHFYPFSRALSFGGVGCNLGCRFCQNYSISHPRKETMERLNDVSAEQLVGFAKDTHCDSIAYTYNEPIISLEFITDVAKTVRHAGLKNVAVSSGYCNKEARVAFYKNMDAANIDLKSFTEDFYSTVCHGSLSPILDTLKYIKNETPCWLEITTLLIPTKNDSPDEINRLTDWVLENMGDSTPLHFSRFFPCFNLTNLEPTPYEKLIEAKNIAKKNGLKYVYLGNIDDPENSNSYCPSCGYLLIERNFYSKKVAGLNNGCCLNCGQKIEGIF